MTFLKESLHKKQQVLTLKKVKIFCTVHHILKDGINPNTFEFARAAQSSFIVQSNNAHAPRTGDIAHGEVQSGGRRGGGKCCDSDSCDSDRCDSDSCDSDSHYSVSSDRDYSELHSSDSASPDSDSPDSDSPDSDSPDSDGSESDSSDSHSFNIDSCKREGSRKKKGSFNLGIFQTRCDPPPPPLDFGFWNFWATFP